MIEEKAAAEGAATAVANAAPAAKTCTVLSTAKALVLSPVFGIVVAGIIGWELWKGSEDAREFKIN
ncbi:MAG: hypothetical protein GY795_12805 [Desulfobacterales bacterium]|nr:hypothetical protein [Desulfobacterales bacterium]